jgi:predicted transcriptional regulator
MDGKLRTIEVDAATAEALEMRAAERGVSVAELVADLALSQAHSQPERPEPARTAAERRWAAVQAGESTVPHEEVVAWLETWGTPAFRPWAER